MQVINIHQAKTHFSHYLKLAQQGEKIVVAKRNIPVVELKPIKKKPKIVGQRILGQYKGKIEVTDAFFEPLPDEILGYFKDPNIEL